MQPTGVHLLVDLWGVAALERDHLEHALAAACTDGGATVVGTRFHHFTPHGVTGVVLLAESHVAIHTWPEHGYAAVDVFTCGSGAVAEAVLDGIVRRLEPERLETRRVVRGEKMVPAPDTAGGG